MDTYIHQACTHTLWFNFLLFCILFLLFASPNGQWPLKNGQIVEIWHFYWTISVLTVLKMNYDFFIFLGAILIAVGSEVNFASCGWNTCDLPATKSEFWCQLFYYLHKNVFGSNWKKVKCNVSRSVQLVWSSHRLSRDLSFQLSDGFVLNRYWRFAIKRMK